MANPIPEQVQKIANVLLIVGGLNWLLHALDYNLVELILGSVPMLVTLVYVVIGLCAIVGIIGLTQK
tara:strand:- start:183 stop:383 length:201 start_codon:yes stop_codon:yes gene_type:complete